MRRPVKPQIHCKTLTQILKEYEIPCIKWISMDLGGSHISCSSVLLTFNVL